MSLSECFRWHQRAKAGVAGCFETVELELGSAVCLFAVQFFMCRQFSLRMSNNTEVSL